MSKYKFGDDFFTEDDVKKKAQELGMTLEEYLKAYPEVKSVTAGKTLDTTIQDETMVSDTESSSVNGSSEQLSSSKAYAAYTLQTQPTEDQILEVEGLYPDISIFDKQERVVTPGSILQGIPAVTEEYQPYEDLINETFKELGVEATKQQISERALEKLREKELRKARQKNQVDFLEQLEDGDLPTLTKEYWDNVELPLDVSQVKDYITKGAKKYNKDYTLANEKTYSIVEETNDVIDQLNTLQQKFESGEEFTDQEETNYLENYNKLTSLEKEYNQSIEDLSQFTLEIEDSADQLRLLKKNYNDLEKFGVKTLLAFKDYGARALYGLQTKFEPQGFDIVRAIQLKETLDKSNAIREKFADDVQFEDAFNDFTSFGKYSHQLLAEQLPIIASLSVGPVGYATLLESSYGGRYHDMSIEDLKKVDFSEEKRSKINKMIQSYAFAVPEVVADRFTTGLRLKAIGNTFTGTKRDLFKTGFKESLSKAAFSTTADAGAGALAEGGTQLYQNLITGRPLLEGVPEATFAGLYFDGVFSSAPAAKGIIMNKLSDFDSYKEVRDIQTKIDALYATQGGLKGEYDSEIKDLVSQRDAKIEEVDAKIKGTKGHIGLTTNSAKRYVEKIAEQEKLRIKAEAIVNNKSLSDKFKQDQLKDLKLEFDNNEAAINLFKTDKGSDYVLMNESNKELYRAKAKKRAEDNDSVIKDGDLETNAEFEYNLESIEKNLSAAKKNVLDDKLIVIRTQADLDAFVEANESVSETAKEAYEQGDNGFAFGDNSVILIENMAKNGRTKVRTHELFHALAFKAFKDDNSIFNGLAEAVVDWTKKNDVFAYERLIQRVERGEDNKLKADEVVAVFMEDVANNRIKLKQNTGLLSMVGSVVSRALNTKHNIDVDIAGIDDTVNLIYGIAKNIDKGSITEADIQKLAGKELAETLKKRGDKVIAKGLFSIQKEADKVLKKSKTQKKIDDLGNKYTRDEWVNRGADETIGEIYTDLESLIRSKVFMFKNLPNFSEEDFITGALGELIPHIRNFNIDKKKDKGDKFGLSGWINSQLMNKIGNVLKKGMATTETFTIDEDADTFKEQVETEDVLESFEEEDLSLQAQLRKRIREQEDTAEYSKFRQELDLNGQKGISNKMKETVEEKTLEILSSSKYVNLDFKVIEKNLQRDFEVALKKTIQDAMGGQNDYVEFLTRNMNTILKHMDISSLVAIERQVKSEDKILTKFVRRLTTQKDVQDAIDNGWLSHIDNPAQGPNLYQILKPNVGEFLKFYNPPLRVESPKKVKAWDAMAPEAQQQFADGVGKNLEQARRQFVEVRSGLKGTRKDTLAERIAGQLAFDATMQVLQSPEFNSIRSSAGKPSLPQAKIREMARRIDRGIEVKFSRKGKMMTVTQQMIQISNDLVNDAVENRRKEVSKDLIKKSSYPMLTEEQFDIALEIADVIVFDFRYEQMSLLEDYREEAISKAIEYNVSQFNNKKGKYRSANYMAEQMLIDGLERFIEPISDIVIDSKPGERSMVDVTVRHKQDADINYGVEKKMGLAQGPATTIKPSIENGKVVFYIGNKVFNAKEYARTEVDAEVLENMMKAAEVRIKELNDLFVSENLPPFKDFNTPLTPEQINAVMNKSYLGNYSVGYRKSEGEFALSSDWLTQKYDAKKAKTSAIDIGVAGLKLLPSNEPEVILNNEVVSREFNKNGIEIPYINESIPAALRFKITKSGKITYTIVQSIDGTSMQKSPVNLSNKKHEKIFAEAIAKALKARREQSFVKNADKVIRKAQKITYKTKPVGMSAFDFDETLIIDGKNFIVAAKGDETTRISSAEWPIKGPVLAEEGFTFDFSDFVNVRGGVDGPLMKDFKKKLGKYGAENMFILTARPQEADKAIHGWLKSKDINIPLENITGLGDSRGEAKAQWMLDKFAEGYNDMYFVDDALPNVKAVKHVLSQLDIKSDVQQARIKFSRTMSQQLNDMIQRSRGIDSEEVISRAIAKRRGKNKNKFQVFLPPSAEDFTGLLYYMLGKGTQGDEDFDFFKKSLIEPFSRAYLELDEARQSILNDVDRLNKEYRSVYKKLGDTMPNSEFTFDNAIRVYLFDKHSHNVPGVSSEEVANMVGRVQADMELLVYAEGLNAIVRTDEYIKPSESWTAGSIASDVQRIVEGIHRSNFLGEWIENKNEIFSEENLNKIEAAYGTVYRESLDDILYRMETGISRPTGKNRITNQWTNWLNNSVGAIMFFNAKSALLQTISTVNYINFEDNNMFAAAKAFANQKQYWQDFSFIFNSDFLKQRRSGLKTDVSQSEIASAVAGATNKAKAAIAYLLKIGFLPTQIADSFAISSGGATFYRNRINKYLAEGKSQKEAQEQAFVDFREVTEESQQSARPDRVSQQQTTNAGRLILAFQNAPMQFNRIIKKSVLDLVNRRGSDVANISRVVYYGGIQSLVFLTLQNALFALAFSDDEEEGMTKKELEKKQKFELTKYERIVNGMVDTLLRGSGITGAVISTLKNTFMKFMSEAEKGKRMNESSIVVEALQISPQIGSKARKLQSGFRAYKWDGEAIPYMSKFDTRNPMYLFAAPIIEGATNIPLNRLLTKTNNLREAANSNNAVWQRAGVTLGWSAWDLNIDGGRHIDEALDKAKKEGKIKGKGTATSCFYTKPDGTSCKNKTTNESGYCYLHD